MNSLFSGSSSRSFSRAAFSRAALPALLLGLLAASPSAVAQEGGATPPATEASAAAATAAAQGNLPDAQEILDAIDANMVFETRTATMSMTVEGRRRTRTFEMRSFARGETDSAIEYLAPARERDTRMLKLGDDLWMYLPSVERTQRISGHMLREGMMGSDMSYEDMMESNELEESYDARVTAAEEVDGRMCWKLELTARNDTVTYARRVSWVDQEHFIPLKQELYALSGMLLKTWVMSELRDFGNGRMFPTRMVVQDHIKSDSRTIIEFSEMSFGVDVPDETFSMRWLERR